jgi:tetratricopeptide (TPR) repeat protein
MTTEIKRDEIAKIFKQLNECKKTLKQANIHSCLLSFKSVLEKTLKTQMLPSDEKELMREVNAFQQALSESNNFKEVFGPVSFQGQDFVTCLDFVQQLIRVGEETIRDNADFRQKDDISVQDIATITNDLEMEAQTIMQLIDKGEYTKAKELIADNDILITFIVQSYNRSGISLRKGGAYDDAIAEFEKAITILPDDEGLHYNLARVFAEKKDWKRAKASIQEAIKINPLFKEGNDLLKYINSKS